MFVASYRNTMRNAKPKYVEPPVVLSMADVRAARAVRLQAALQEQRAAEQERIAKIRKDASERAKAYAAELRLAGHRYRPTVAEIERRACDLFGLSRQELHGNRRSRNVVFARQFVMYWAARLTPLSTPQIGRLLGGRDHTTVLHGKTAYANKRAAMGRHLRRVR